MAHRSLYIAAYDVSDEGRLRRACALLKGYASGRQKSVFECFLGEAEKRALLAEVSALLDPAEDRFILLRLEPRGCARSLGRGAEPANPSCLYVG